MFNDWVSGGYLMRSFTNSDVSWWNTFLGHSVLGSGLLRQSQSSRKNTNSWWLTFVRTRPTRCGVLSTLDRPMILECAITLTLQLCHPTLITTISNSRQNLATMRCKHDWHACPSAICTETRGKSLGTEGVQPNSVEDYGSSMILAFGQCWSMLVVRLRYCRSAVSFQSTRLSQSRAFAGRKALGPRYIEFHPTLPIAYVAGSLEWCVVRGVCGCFPLYGNRSWNLLEDDLHL